MSESVRSGVGIALGFLLLAAGLVVLGVLLFLAVGVILAGHTYMGLGIAGGSLIGAGLVLKMILSNRQPRP